ncbi:MAG: hypothetical protein ACRET2_17370 [Steroidobacteraceae bacterium]
MWRERGGVLVDLDVREAAAALEVAGAHDLADDVLYVGCGKAATCAAAVEKITEAELG